MERKVLKRLREKHGYTQTYMAQKAGINRSYYGFIENGKRNPNINIAIKIANIFNLEIKDVFPEDVFFNNKCYKM